jgi:hypothetical protein
MSGRKVHWLAAISTAYLLGITAASAADVNVIYGCCSAPPQACAGDGCMIEQSGVTIIYGRQPQPVAYEPQAPAVPYYVVNQGPTYAPVLVPYAAPLYDDYAPIYGYPGYRPFGEGHRPFGRPFGKGDFKPSDMQGNRAPFRPAGAHQRFDRSPRVVQVPPVGIGGVGAPSAIQMRARARAGMGRRH